MEHIYKYFKEINKLNTIVRTGWLNRNVPLERLESVGEHIFTMALLSLATIDKYNLKLNVEKVLKMILIHELGEIDIGDIALPTGNQIIEKYEGECFFQPCYHATEPKCAVRDAVADGEIDPERHGRYTQLLDEMKQRWRERYD